MPVKPPLLRGPNERWRNLVLAVRAAAPSPSLEKVGMKVRRAYSDVVRPLRLQNGAWVAPTLPVGSVRGPLSFFANHLTTAPLPGSFR
jgi:hypothetical protein